MMKNSDRPRPSRGIITICVALLAFASIPMLLSARTQTASINVVNNSNRTIRNLYLSHVDADDWGGNQLGNNQISPGQSYTVTNVTWDQQQIKVVAEDQDGCFLTSVVSNGDNASWTITNDTTADCGNLP
jgi:hypothetical protein